MLEYMKIYPGTKDLVKRYPVADRGMLYEAVMDYAFSGTLPDWPEDDLKWFVWDSLQSKVDVAEKAMNNGRKGGKASHGKSEEVLDTPSTPLEPTSNDTDSTVKANIKKDIDKEKEENIKIDKEKEKKKEDSKRHSVAHRPPTVAEVAEYCREKGYGIDAEHFVSYYESNGWKVGKNPMKDWRAACRTWARNEYSKPAGKTVAQTNYAQRSYEETKPGELPDWYIKMIEDEQRKEAAEKAGINPELPQWLAEDMLEEAMAK